MISSRQAALLTLERCRKDDAWVSAVLDGVIKTYILSPDGVENTLTYIFQPGTCVAMHEDMINVPKMWCKTVTPCTLIEMSPGPYELAEERSDQLC